MDDITRLNYCTKAVVDIKNSLELHKPFKDSYRTLNIIIELLQEAVKFLLPNCGELIELESFNQAHYDLLKLPYPITVFEAPWKHEYGKTKIDVDIGFPTLLSERRIALVIESTHGVINQLPQFNFISDIYSDKGGALIIPISEIEGVFVVAHSGCFLPYGSKIENNKSDKSEVSRKLREHYEAAGISTDAPRISVEPVPILPEKAQQAALQLGMEKAKMLAIHDSADEAQMVLQACAVMNCENIEIEDFPANQKLNKSRLKKKKQPLFDYKVLGIGQEFYKQARSNTKSTEGNKRMHLRRGHIRRYRSGITTWVKNTVVNSENTEMVKKSYRLKQPIA